MVRELEARKCDKAQVTRCVPDIRINGEPYYLHDYGTIGAIEAEFVVVGADEHAG